MNAVLLKFLAIATLLVVQVFCGSASAQDYPAAIKAVLIANSGAGQTIELKDGRRFAYRQLVELPEVERKKMLKLATERSARIAFEDWENLVIEALEQEIDRETAIVEAQNKEKKERLAVLEAQNKEKKERLAVLEARGRDLDRELAAIINMNTPQYEAIVRKGGKLPKSAKFVFESNIKVEDALLKAGANPEAFTFMKSVLARPDAFE